MVTCWPLSHVMWCIAQVSMRHCTGFNEKWGCSLFLGTLRSSGRCKTQAYLCILTLGDLYFCSWMSHRGLLCSPGWPRTFDSLASLSSCGIDTPPGCFLYFKCTRFLFVLWFFRLVFLSWQKEQRRKPDMEEMEALVGVVPHSGNTPEMTLSRTWLLLPGKGWNSIHSCHPWLF